MTTHNGTTRGLAAGFTVGALLARQMLGSESLSGLSATVSSIVMAGPCYAAPSLSGGVLSLLPIPVLLWARRVRPGAPRQQGGAEI